MITPEKLQALLQSNKVIPLKFAGQGVLLDASGALIWPKHKLVVFSDLHLEKGSFLSQFANPLPRFDSKDTIKRMEQVLLEYECHQVICLGDSFHDGNAFNRMQQEDLTHLNKLVRTVPIWTWVLGNHDPHIPESILGERVNSVQLSNILLVHEPVDLSVNNTDTELAYDGLDPSKFDNLGAQIVGHFHPKSSLKMANKKVNGKCFLHSKDTLFMPAFGKYTGGLDIKHEAFEAFIDLAYCDAFLIYDKRIFMTKGSRQVNHLS